LPQSRSAGVRDEVQLASKAPIEHWQVMYEGFVNVRKEKSLSSLILNRHWKCEVMEGSRDGAWVKLANEPGYIKISLQIYTLLRKVPSYRKITKGTCAMEGMYSIEDVNTCEQAAATVGHRGRVKRSQYVPSPEGCYIKDGKLWLSEDPANRGNGVVGPRHPLCAAVRGHAEDQKTCEPLPDHPLTTLEPGTEDRHSEAHRNSSATSSSTTATTAPVTTSTTSPTTTTKATTTSSVTSTAKVTTTSKAETTEAAATTKATTTATTATTTEATTTLAATTTKATTTTVATTTKTTTTKATTTITGTTITITTTTLMPGARPRSEWKDPSLFCFEVMCVKPEDPTWYEPRLVKVQQQQKVSIFACDEFTVFSNGGTYKLQGNWTTTELKTSRVGMGDLDKAGQTTNSWLNTRIFQQAWEEVNRDGRFRSHDWTVKVDPDAVFFPERLRDLVRPHTKPAGAWYFLNCNRYPPSPPGEAKLYGSVEVFSRKAVEAYVSSKDVCINSMEWQGWGEDFFMQKCMDKLRVMAVYMFKWIGDDRCWPAKCTAKDRVAFHDFKDIDKWFDCWGQSTQR